MKCKANAVVYLREEEGVLNSVIWCESNSFKSVDARLACAICKDHKYLQQNRYVHIFAVCFYTLISRKYLTVRSEFRYSDWK